MSLNPKHCSNSVNTKQKEYYADVMNFFLLCKCVVSVCGANENTRRHHTRHFMFDANFVYFPLLQICRTEEEKKELTHTQRHQSLVRYWANIICRILGKFIFGMDESSSFILESRIHLKCPSSRCVCKTIA